MIALAVLLSSMLALFFAGDMFQSGDDDAPQDTAEDGRDNERDLLGTSAGDRLNGAEQSADIIYGFAGDDTLSGGDFYLQTTGYADTIYGGAGSDYIHGGRGYDLLFGGDGTDTVKGGFGDDVLYGGSGSDMLEGGFRDDTLYGGAGNDILRGGEVASGAGYDVLYGGEGDDYLNDMLSNYDAPNQDRNPSTMFGGAGDDILSFDDGGTYSGGSGADIFNGVIEVGEDSVVNITDFNPAEDRLLLRLYVDSGDGEGLSLVQGADAGAQELYFGTNLVARITTAAPIDLSDIETRVLLRASDPNDGIIFTGTSGDDVISTFRDWGTIYAGAGNDTVYVDSSTIYGGTGNDLLIESGESYSILYGEDGADTLSAVGNDYYYGQNSLFDSPNFDTLYGGDGDDLIILYDGGEAYGGAGNDVFSLAFDRDWASIADAPPALIQDFNPLQDVLRLETDSNPNNPPYMPITNVAISVWSDGLGADIMVEGKVVAKVAGGQTLTVNDLVIGSAQA